MSSSNDDRKACSSPSVYTIVFELIAANAPIEEENVFLGIARHFWDDEHELWMKEVLCNEKNESACVYHKRDNTVTAFISDTDTLLIPTLIPRTCRVFEHRPSTFKLG